MFSSLSEWSSWRDLRLEHHSDLDISPSPLGALMLPVYTYNTIDDTLGACGVGQHDEIESHAGLITRSTGIEPM
jgi:hypothetical protein